MECNIFLFFLYYLHVYIFLQFDLKYNAHSMQLQEEKKYPPKDIPSINFKAAYL